MAGHSSGPGWGLLCYPSTGLRASATRGAKNEGESGREREFCEGGPRLQPPAPVETQ